MARPWYESGGDLANEGEVAKKIASMYRARLHKLKPKYGVDYLALRYERPWAYMEIKCRTTDRLKYPTYLISVDKIESGVRHAALLGIKAILLVQWRDVLGWVNMNDVAYGGKCVVAIGGRTDRGDAQDLEPVYHIPVELFSLFGTNDPASG